MANKKKKPVLFPVVFMIIISAVFTFILASLNAASLDLIEAQEALKNQRSLLYLFDQPIPEDRESVQTLTRIYLKSRVLMTSLTTKPFQRVKSLATLSHSKGPDFGAQSGAISPLILTLQKSLELISSRILRHQALGGGSMKLLLKNSLGA